MGVFYILIIIHSTAIFIQFFTSIFLWCENQVLVELLPLDQFPRPLLVTVIWGLVLI